MTQKLKVLTLLVGLGGGLLAGALTAAPTTAAAARKNRCLDCAGPFTGCRSTYDSGYRTCLTVPEGCVAGGDCSP